MNYSEILTKGQNSQSMRLSRSLCDEDIEEPSTFCEDIEESQQESLISAVKDVLPDLGTGFILECLRYYNQSSEDVIDAILNDKLADHLKILVSSLEKKDVQNFPTMNFGDQEERLPFRMNLLSLAKTNDKAEKKAKAKKNKNETNNARFLEQDPDIVDKVKKLSMLYNDDNTCLSNYEARNKVRHDPSSLVDFAATDFTFSEGINPLNEAISYRHKSESIKIVEDLDNIEEEKKVEEFFVNPARRLNETHRKQVQYREKHPNKTFAGTNISSTGIQETKRRKERTLRKAESR